MQKIKTRVSVNDVMNEELTYFFETMLYFFPAVIEEYERHIDRYGERLDTVVIEDIFMPEVIEIIKQDKNNELLKAVFEFFEKVSNSDDEYLLNIFSITVLEILGNDRDILEKAKKYMGPKTIQLQIEADRDLGRIK